MNPKVTMPLIFRPFRCGDLVRLGRDHDGGYLVNREDILKSQSLLSFGIGDDCSFEQDFAKIQPCPVSAYDGTLTPVQVAVMQERFFQSPNQLTVQNIGPGADQVNPVDVIQDRTFLKCDIEDAEYRILDDIIRISDRLSGLVMEFHEIQEPERFNLLTNFIAKVQLKLVHVHINNWTYMITGDVITPNVIELTFSSSSNISWQPVQLPHRLDQPNCADRADFIIVF